MIDTVQLFADDYRLREGNQFTVKQTVLPTGEVQGVLRVCNNDRLQVDDRGGLLHVQASLPKLLYGSSLREVTEKDYPQVVKLLDAEMREIGAAVAGGVVGMRLQRVDYCSNLDLHRPVADAISVLSQLSMPRRVERQYGHETASWANGNIVTTAYNKIAEILSNRKTAAAERERLLSMPQNILRIECRLRRRRVIESTLQLPHAKLRDVWDKDLRRRVLLGEFDRLTASAEPGGILSAQSIIEYLSEHRRGAFPRLLQRMGSGEFLRLFDNDLSLVRYMMRQAGMSERTVRWRLAHLRRLSAEGIQLTPAGKVLREIRAKLAA